MLKRHTEMHIGIFVKYPIVLSTFNQNWNVPTNFNKASQPYHENQFSSSRDIKADGQSDFIIPTDGQSGVTMQSIELSMHLKRK